MTETNSAFIRFAPTIAVRDMASAIKFYTTAFGLKVTFENGDPVGFAILKRDTAEVHLTLNRTHKASVANVAHLLVHDVDAVHRACLDATATIVKEMRNGVGATEADPNGLRAFVVADPFGNRIDVAAPHDG